MYDVDFDHQFAETRKYDAKPTYKFLGYRPGVAVIDDLIVGIENSDGGTSIRRFSSEGHAEEVLWCQAERTYNQSFQS